MDIIIVTFTVLYGNRALYIFNGGTFNHIFYFKYVTNTCKKLLKFKEKVILGIKLTNKFDSKESN